MKAEWAALLIRPSIEAPQFLQRLRTVSVAGNQRRAFARQRKTVRAASGLAPSRALAMAAWASKRLVWFLMVLEEARAPLNPFIQMDPLENLAAPSLVE